MWPQLLDLSRDECRRGLRQIELEAYSGILSAFRAQGDLSKEKKQLLQDLQKMLSISTERHRAEVRRAVNDEKLTTIAVQMCGPNVSSEWLVEGRRLVPLMPRLVPQTAFTLTANQMAQMQAEKNACMPLPSETGNKDVNVPSSGSTTPSSITSSKMRPSSPTSNVVVLPSGMSIHIKGGLNTDEDDEFPMPRKRARSSSIESPVTRPGVTTVSLPSSKVTYTTTAANSIHGISPMKITISKSPQKSHTTVTPSQKVILVSSSGQSNTPNILQKSITVPIVKSSASSQFGSQTKTTIVGGREAANGNIGNIVSVATTQGSAASAVGTATTAFVSNSISIARPRHKTITTRPKIQSQSHKPGIVIPMGPQPVQPSPVQLKPGTKSTIQIKQEGGMKIITHSVPAAGQASKILPKPQFTTSSGNQVVVVTSGAQSSVAMVTKAVTTVSGHPIASKVLNITTHGGKVIGASTSRAGANVVTMNPKTLQLTAVKGGTGTTLSSISKSASAQGVKPNVIVVQRAHPKSLATPSTPPVQARTPPSAGVSNSPFEKEFGSFIQNKIQEVSKPAGWPVKGKVVEKQQTAKVERSRSDSEQSGRSSILAELIHAAGIVPESGSGSNSGRETPVEEGTKVQEGFLNQWVEIDQASATPPVQPYQTEDASAIKALLEMKSGNSGRQSSSTLDLSQLTQMHFQPSDLEALEQALSQQQTPAAVPQVESESDVTTEESTSALSGQQFYPSSSTSSMGTIPGVVRGELDPQTGMFIQLDSGNQRTKSLITSALKQPEPAKVAEKTQMDIFSSALAEAQIDLDPYQFIDDDDEQGPYTQGKLQPLHPKTSQGPPGSTSHSGHGIGSNVSATPGSSSSVTSTPGSSSTLMSILSPTSEQASSSQGNSQNVGAVTSGSSQSSQSSTEIILEQKGKSVFVPIQESTASGKPGVSTIHIIKQQVVHPAPSRPAVVTVESSGLDPAYMKIEDFASQRLEDRESEEVQELGSPETSSSFESIDPNNPTRLGKRKRKPPPAPDDSPPQSVGGWVRAALGLLQRVSRFRGANREKGEINAASWFTRPVDENEAPGYYKIIKTPMDFSTIKRKLESGAYSGFIDFDADMLLVRDNCHKYNPPGHDARKDCDEVFTFYQAEYEKMLDRWQKMQSLSPASKKSKIEQKSPTGVQII